MLKFLKSSKYSLLFILIAVFFQNVVAQETTFTKADTLRGSITPQRAWWDVIYYDLNVTIQPKDSSIIGYNEITYEVTKPAKGMQIDLQDPLQIDQVQQNGKDLDYHRLKNSNAYIVDVPKDLEQGSQHKITVYYHGRPKVAQNPPWDGGFIWAQDSLGNRWIATANQGLGASVWWPNKDHQTAEPDSMLINITVPEPMINVSNGRLRDTTRHNNGMTTWSWFVSNPINNYNIAVNAGNYVNFTETYAGKRGTIDLSYWVLEHNLEKVIEQFK
jgi:aminopeptidase N